MKAAAILFLAMTIGLPGCQDEEGGCESDQDCPTGKYCRLMTGQCEYDCLDDDDCPTGWKCSSRGRCEEGCRQTNAGIEKCDGIDNDCDGDTDENLEPRACGNEYCPGTEHCRSGVWLCDAPIPGLEDCDGVDNDCDGETDEDLQAPECPMQQGVCAGSRRVCQGLQGWSPSCDYGQDFEAVEVTCDDMDNDCDGSTDEELTRDVCLVVNQHGECDGIETCSHGTWFCHGPEARPEQCDQLDNDCDGLTDEGAPVLASCEFGSAAGDGLDNNCDGRVDEAGGCSLRVQVGEVDVYMDSYEAAVFESPDCSGAIYGQETDNYPLGWPPDPREPLLTLYACSLPGILPSGSLSWYQARRACEAQGRRLCTLAEWWAACEGDPPQVFPYGDAYQPGTCNTISAGVDAPVENGSFADCVSQPGIHDLSGNLWEWMADECTWEAGRMSIQSGSWQCEYSDGVPCDHNNPDHAETILSNYSCHYRDASHWCAYPWQNLGIERVDHGFRCCSDP